MSRAIHLHYDALTYPERAFVDDCFHYAAGEARRRGVPLRGDDTVERAVDALARAVLESSAQAADRLETVRDGRY